MTLPRPSGVSVPETDCADGFTATVYENKTADDFSAYCASLQAHGWSPVAQSNFNSAVVSATYAGYGKTVHTYFAVAEGCIQLIVGGPSPESLPQPYAAELTATAPKAAMLGLNRNNGMALVFTLSDGSYIVYDGGETSADADLLYQYLSENNRRADGMIVIAAWVITHEHTDHYGMIPSFASAYGDSVKVEAFLANGYAPASVNPAISTYAGFLSDQPNGTEARIRGIAATLGAQVVKVHTGQAFEIRDAELKILFTHEDLYPNADPGAPINGRTMDANDLSVVSMLTLGGKKFLLAGDALDFALRKLVEYYGESDVLVCDVLQVPHHGNLGGIRCNPDGENTGGLFIAAANPSVAWFSTDEASFAGYCNSAFNTLLLARVGSCQTAAETREMILN